MGKCDTHIIGRLFGGDNIVVRITDENFRYWREMTGQMWFRPGDLIYNHPCVRCGRPCGGRTIARHICGYCDLYNSRGIHRGTHNGMVMAEVKA